MLRTVRHKVVGGVLAAGVAAAMIPVMSSAASAAPSRSAGAVTASAAPSDGDAATRAIAVRFADTHWNWTAWNNRTPVKFGDYQHGYQCAEFVARSLADAGLVPGLSPNAPQSAYADYVAPNGLSYDLLLISPWAPRTLYNYLIDSGLMKDVGNRPALALPGDVVVTYLGYHGEASHMGLVASAPLGEHEATVDAHDKARIRYGYHYYAPSHLLTLEPNALVQVWNWAAAQWARHGDAVPADAAAQRLVEVGEPPQV
jgi:cell wall-associated NlpC family hydrolase